MNRNQYGRLIVASWRGEETRAKMRLKEETEETEEEEEEEEVREEKTKVEQT